MQVANSVRGLSWMSFPHTPYFEWAQTPLCFYSIDPKDRKGYHLEILSRSGLS